MKSRKSIALAAKPAERVTLRQPLALANASNLEVDREAHVIRNVSIIAEGPAIGHGFHVDKTMVRQVATAIRRHKGGSMSHLGHAAFLGPDQIFVRIGRVKVTGLEPGDEAGVPAKIRGDVHLAPYAASSPSGDLRTYIEDLADSDPGALGLSIVFEPAEYVRRKDKDGNELPPAGRVSDVLAVDFVGDPAANPDGLLSVGPGSDDPAEPDAPSPVPKPFFGESLMNPKLRAYLLKLGLKADASDAEAIAYWHQLGEEQRKEADALAAVKVEPPAVPPVVTPPATEPNKPVNPAELAKAMLAAERERVKSIKGLVRLHKLPAELAEQMCDDGLTVEEAQSKALEKIAERDKPVSLGTYVGPDLNLESLPDAISDAIMLRAGAVKLYKFVKIEGRQVAVMAADGKPEVRAPHERSATFRRMRLSMMIRHQLAALGVPDAFQLSDSRVVELLGRKTFAQAYPSLVGLAQSTSGFGNIQVDTINKTLTAAYIDAVKTWDLWARKTTNADMKTITRAALSESPDLVARNEGGEIKYVTLSDSKETYALIEHIGGIALTRKSMINDDLDAFSRIPMLQAAAAVRKEEDLVYSILTTNAAMADAVALFHATHANVVSSAGGVPSVAQLSGTEKLINLQMGPKGAAHLNLQAKFLIVPVALKATALQLINSTVDPAKSNATVNPYANMLTVIPQPRLDTNSSVLWYLAADYRDGQIDTVEICFLEGEETPQLAQETDFDTDDVRFKVRHTAAAQVIDHRGLARNKGAA